MAKRIPRPTVRLLVLTNCDQCPHRKIVRTPRAGYAHDWLCGLSQDKLISGYIEWASEEPKEIPDWCPLEKRVIKKV